MARREWAEQWAFDASEGDTAQIRMTVAAKRLQAEHARAVRIVKRAKALQLHGLRDTDTNEFLEGYEAACVDILAALSKGRA